MPSADDELLARLPAAAVVSRWVIKRNVWHEAFELHADWIRLCSDDRLRQQVVRAHQDVEDGYEFLAKRLLITVFSAPNHYGEFDNAGVTMTTDGDIDGLHGDPSPDRGRSKAHYDSYLRSILTIRHPR